MVTEGTSLVDTMRRIQSARPVAGPNEVGSSRNHQKVHLSVYRLASSSSWCTCKLTCPTWSDPLLSETEASNGHSLNFIIDGRLVGLWTQVGNRSASRLGRRIPDSVIYHCNRMLRKVELVGTSSRRLVHGLYCWGFMRQLREFDRELTEARRNGRLLGRGLHSSASWLNVSTFCGIRWVHDFSTVY
jgi:hypothetical protein